MIIKPALLHFKFDGFANLPSEVDSYVNSDVQTNCNGNKWQLGLYTGGESDEAEEGWVGLYLSSRGNKESLETAFSLALKDAKGETVQNNHCDYVFKVGSTEEYGSYQYMKRDIILHPNNNILKHVKDKQDDHYDPESKLSNKMLKLLESGERADASFQVGDCIFNLHSRILHTNSPILASHLHPSKSRKKSSVIIEGVSAAVFKLVLQFIYSELRPTVTEMLEHGKELIDATNRYELVDLKMAVEHVLVRERILTTENVSDYILFADAQSCPLLKEYTMTFLLLNAEDVLKSKHSKCLKESGEVLSELVLLMSRRNEGDDTLTMNELRKELGKRKLDLDGSKDVLVSRLEEAKRQKTE